MTTSKNDTTSNNIAEPVKSPVKNEKKEELVNYSLVLLTFKSEEDRQLVETLDMLVERLQDVDRTLHRPALEALRTQIKSSAVSLTSVPKALKFLRNHYARLVTIHTALSDIQNQVGQREIGLYSLTFCRNSWQIFCQSLR
jgi:26S proteasome regulatory subunit N1